MAQKKQKPVLDWRIPKGFKGEIDADRYQLAAIFRKIYKREIDILVEDARRELHLATICPQDENKDSYFRIAWKILATLSVLNLADLKAMKLFNKVDKDSDSNREKMRKDFLAKYPEAK